MILSEIILRNLCNTFSGVLNCPGGGGSWHDMKGLWFSVIGSDKTEVITQNLIWLKYIITSMQVYVDKFSDAQKFKNTQK